MDGLEEQVNELRYEICEGCQEQFTEQEVVDGEEKCEFCQHVEETGRMVAGLQD